MWMKVILKKSVESLGEAGDIVTVKAGYGRNYLIPQGLGMLANDNFIQESSRCVYENEDIMVFHDFMSYPDNSREAVMGVAMLKDGKIIRMETGATTLA